MVTIECTSNYCMHRIFSIDDILVKGKVHIVGRPDHGLSESIPFKWIKANNEEHKSICNYDYVLVGNLFVIFVESSTTYSH